VNSAYRFKQLTISASKPSAPQGTAGSITQLDVFCHQQYPLEKFSAERACNEMKCLSSKRYMSFDGDISHQAEFDRGNSKDSKYPMRNRQISIVIH
jgi:hypothetical protein